MKKRCTIIIPHYNQSIQLVNCLNSLVNQNMPSEEYEILVVDNGTIGIEEVIHRFKSYDQIRWLNNEVDLNPYVSRNIGIKAAQGEIIAFLDASCIPSSDWLSNGIQHISSGKKFVAGRFYIECPSKRLSDKVHGLLYLNNEKNIKNHYGVPAGNLFIDQSVIDDIGLFDQDRISGNDVAWSKKAMDREFVITYAPECVVKYFSPDYSQLLQKMKKYAKGAAHQMKVRGEWKNLYRSRVFGLLPMKPKTFITAMCYRELQDLGLAQKIFLWILVWRAKAVYALCLF